MAELFQSLKSRPLRSAAQLLAALLAFPSFFSVVSFAAAVTPSAAAAKGHEMPSHWIAGVMNHGSYYEWYTISDAPVLFAVSLITFVCCLGYIWWTVAMEAIVARATGTDNRK